VPIPTYRFGGFELDCARYELRLEGRPLRLERIPTELLMLLLERDGALVSRQEIVDRLWGRDVFVDTEHGINTAIRKIRAALRDDADDPRFVQTVVGKGYRFAAELAVASPAPPSAPAERIALEPSPPRVTRPRRPAVAILGTAAVLLSVAGLLGWKLSPGPRPEVGPRLPIRSIAVLPFVNLGDPSQEYFADGMTDEIITRLAKSTSLRVISRTSVMRYRGVSRPLHEIAQELGTDGILEGAISRAPRRLHLTVQLVQGEDDAHIWAESYDRDLDDTLSLLSELSSTVAREVNAATFPQTPSPMRIQPEAYNAYLRARVLWFNGDYGKAQDLYQEAVERQPGWAAAWSGLADAYTGQAMKGPSESAELRQRAGSSARRAVELDDTLAEAHHSMAALYYFLEWNWRAADAESRRATQLDGSLAEAHHLRSYVLRTLDRLDEALQEQRLASDLDPDLRPSAMGRAFLHLRRYDEAVAALRAAVKMHPHGTRLRRFLADAYHFAGREEESVEEYAGIYRSEDDGAAAAAIHRELRGGPRAVARWRLDHWKKTVGRREFDPYELATLSARAGLEEQALCALETAFGARSASLPFLQLEPDFIVLHAEPRYRALVRKLDLPPKQ